MTLLILAQVASNIDYLHIAYKVIFWGNGDIMSKVWFELFKVYLVSSISLLLVWREGFASVLYYGMSKVCVRARVRYIYLN